MPRLRCLTREELTAFHLGDLSEATLEELAAHLEDCPRCEAAARALDSITDPVVAAYRESALAAPLGEPAAPPERVGEYEILGELGRGGMGVVYKARHRKLQRLVALKMLLGGSFVTSEERARFRVEAEAVARLSHPHIVQIYEVGEHEVDAGLPRPYFTLEFVSGGNLANRLAGRPQAPRQAAAWLASLARAVHYAHQQGIVHRDLKPSNVLLTEAGEPTLCDFGVAKLMTGSDVKTRSGTLLGTAEYMAPEQATEGEKVGPAADVYALGAILYTMLTGRPPFQGLNTLHILEQVRSQPPVPLRRLVPHLPRNIETICLKCLQKEPNRRYASAQALAEDLEHFLEGRPIVARPAGLMERAGLWIRRRPLIAGLLALVVLLAILGAALVIGLWRGAEARAKVEAEAKRIAQEKEREEALGRQENLRLLSSATLNHGLALCAQGETNHGLLLLARALEQAEEAGAAELAHAARVNLAVWRRRIVTLRARLHHDDWVWAVAFSPDGGTALTGGKDCMARRWDTRDGRLLGSPLRHRHPVWFVGFSPDGRTIATGSGDDEKHAGEARFWDAASGEPLGPPLTLPDETHAVIFHRDGQRFLTVCDAEVRLWRFADRAARKVDSRSIALPHPRPARHIAKLQPRLGAIFSPDGKRVLTGGEDGTARLWDAETGVAFGQPLRHNGPVLSMTFSADGQTIVTGSYDGAARLWDAATCRQHGPEMRHLGRVHTVAMRYDGQYLATGSSVEEKDARTEERIPTGGEVRLWRVATGELFGEPMRQSQPVWSVAFRTGGGKLLIGGRDRTARFYSLFDGALMGKPLEHEGNVANVVFSPDGRLALTASAGGDRSASARLWEVAPGDPVVWSEIAVLIEGKRPLVASLASDGRKLLGVGGIGAREYDVVSGQPVGPLLEHSHWVGGGAYSPDGRNLITIEDKDRVHFWDRASGRHLAELPPGADIVSKSFSADGSLLALFRTDRRACVYRVPSGERVCEIPQLPLGESAFVLHPDGRRAYSHDDKSNVREWDARTGKLLRVLRTPEPVRFLQFIAAKTVVITGGSGHLTRAWELETSRPLSGPLADLDGSISSLTFSPDGACILTGVLDRRNARLWDTATGKPIGPPVHHHESVPVVAFTADGKRMMSGSVNGEFRSQEVPLPVAGEAERIRCWIELLTGMKMDDQGAIADLDAEMIRQRRERLREWGGPPDAIGRP